jgi:DNA-directed RNA polymerase specialized sigma24 family protein
MGRQGEAFTRRLRRLARMLVDDGELADSLVLETLTAAEDRPVDLHSLFMLLISRRRAMAGEIAKRGRRAGGSQPDIVRAFEALPLQDREILALTLVEQLSYEDGARILKLSMETFISRLTQARLAFGRVAEGERHVVLRLVK